MIYVVVEQHMIGLGGSHRDLLALFLRSRIDILFIYYMEKLSQSERVTKFYLLLVHIL